MTLTFRTTDTKQAYGLEIRRGVVELHRTLPAAADVTMTGDEAYSATSSCSRGAW
jgi:hypothetical protein